MPLAKRLHEGFGALELGGSSARTETQDPLGAQAIGVQYFQQVLITWSIRNRGNVQRTHIMSVTSKNALKRMLSIPRKLPR